MFSFLQPALLKWRLISMERAAAVSELGKLSGGAPPSSAAAEIAVGADSDSALTNSPKFGTHNSELLKRVYHQ